MRLFRTMLTVAALAVAGPSIKTAQAADCETPSIMRFSLVPQNDAQKDLAELQPLLKELQAALAMPVESVAPSSYDAVVEGLLGGGIHIARLGPASYVSAKKQDARITPFASYYRRANAYQEAGAFYYTLLIVRETGEFKNIESLRGKKLALVDPGSTSGALVPRHVFNKVIGSSLENYFSRIVYSGSHDQSARRVADGSLDAAFVGSSNLAAYVSASKPERSGFRILWRSKPIPLDPFVYRGQLCESIKEKINLAFFGKDGKQNQAVLEKLNAARFIPVTDADYEIIRGMQ
jgi:phosphonate transport system substrate-binding protein